MVTLECNVDLDQWVEDTPVVKVFWLPVGLLFRVRPSDLNKDVPSVTNGHGEARLQIALHILLKSCTSRAQRNCKRGEGGEEMVVLKLLTMLFIIQGV
eukprot:c14549_g2_i1 orf=229-522(+)